MSVDGETPAVNRAGDGRAWTVGRAGMLYRDLLGPGPGGRFIASQIHIREGGPTADWVHYHRVRFQLVYCTRGWVRVVYEDQGPPFVMHAGDCVLQPPEIRHRVLESAPGSEVVEVAGPADYETRADEELDLPTGRELPERDFGGQRFVRHVAAEAVWTPGPRDGFEARDLGVAAGTGGVAAARVLRPRGEAAGDLWSHAGELLFRFVLRGSARLARREGAPPDLGPADALVVPPGLDHALTECSANFEVLEVAVPAREGHSPRRS